MRKFTVELILPDEHDLHTVSALIETGCQNMLLPHPKGFDPEKKFKPELVVCTPFNESHVTMVLVEVDAIPKKQEEEE